MNVHLTHLQKLCDVNLEQNLKEMLTSFCGIQATEN